MTYDEALRIWAEKHVAGIPSDGYLVLESCADGRHDRHRVFLRWVDGVTGNTWKQWPLPEVYYVDRCMNEIFDIARAVDRGEEIPEMRDV